MADPEEELRYFEFFYIDEDNAEVYVDIRE